MNGMPSPVSLDKTSTDMHEHLSQALGPSTQQVQPRKDEASAGSYEQSNRPTAESQQTFVDKLGQDLSVFLNELSPPVSDVIQGPSQYIHSLPAKETRNALVDALNAWLRLPDEPIHVIKKIITLLHEASLLLDDIQDGSVLRRGMPATHTIYGEAQTINSAGYTIIKAIEETLKLGQEYVQVVLEHLKVLYIGQSYDLHWTVNLECPSEQDYLRALDSKTGGLFHLLLNLMTVVSEANGASGPDLHLLVFLLRRHFAIRDGYQNLLSEEYSKHKGFCEDLDEGKYTMPIIHALRSLTGEPRNLLQNLLSQRHIKSHSCKEHKLIILRLLKQSGSLDHTQKALRELQAEINKETTDLESITSTSNKMLRCLLERLYV